MDKETWCTRYLSEESPECLPLPDGRESGGWGRQALSLATESDVAELSASLLLLLGLYGGLQEGALLLQQGEGFRPVRLSWQGEDSPQDFIARVQGWLEETGNFTWQEEEIAELLGWEPGRGLILCLEAERGWVPGDRYALGFCTGGGEASICYDEGRYSPAFIRELLLAWGQILQSLRTAPSLDKVRVTSAETEQRLNSFNDNAHDYDRQTTVVELFRQRAAEFPEHMAVIYEERAYTYAQVEDMSDRLAACLARQGLGRGDRVAVFIPRSEYMVIASLGVLKAGCAYEPLDPNYPDERLSFMAKDAEVKVILVADELKPRLVNFPDYKGLVLTISEVAGLPRATEEEIKRLEGPKPEDLFILIYTSGTTGVPKGVRLLHSNLMCYAAWYRRYFAPTPETKVTCYNSYGFDGSLADMYPILTVGGTVVVVPEEKKLDLPALAELIRRHGISISDMPSQVGRQFALTMDCPSLRYIVGGGEKLVSFEPVYPYIMANEYGPTEATVSVTCYDVTKYEADIPIGTPNDNTDIYIVDAYGRRVPPGALGELWIAGPQVAGGYLNRPEKTKEVFVANPFSTDPDYATAYRTGDIVRYLLDGNIQFVGRRDGLVKIRGFRVELSEVEGVIHDFPQVENAAVAAWDNPAGGKFIAAYVVSKEPIDQEALANFIRERKPPYMVPAAIVQLEAIPRNQNGKLNKKALPVPELRGSLEEYVAPKNDIEKELCRGFAAALGMERASAEEDFFQAGGDSLSIVRLLSECRDLKLNFNLIYEGKTPAGIAALLAERSQQATGEKKESHFFGPLQELHYNWGNSLEEGYGLHCDAYITLDAATDLERMAVAIETVLLAHPAVDARLTMVEGELRWQQGDLQGLRPVVEEMTRAEYEKLKNQLRQSLNKPDTRMFVMRLFAIREEDGNLSKVFYFDILHPIIDGDSIDIFLQDLDAAYRGEEVQPEEYSIFDYYDEIEAKIGTEAYRQEQQWNRDFVRSFTSRLSEMPGDLDPKGENDTKDIFVPIHVDLAAVDTFTKAQGITDGTLTAAAFGLLQGRNNGEQAGVVLTIYNGRDDIRFERTMGAIYRHYPLCVSWDENMGAGDFVRQTQENVLLCRRHALYEGDPVPLIVAFSYQGEDMDTGFDFCGGRAEYEEIEDFEEENFDFFVHRRSDDFYVNLTYNTKEYSEKFVETFLQNYARVIQALVAGMKPADIIRKLADKEVVP